MRSLRGAGDWSALSPLDGLVLLDELALEFVLDESMLEPVLGVVLLVDELVEGLVEEFVEDGVVAGVVDELVDEGIAFGSVCEVVAAPLPGEAAVLSLFAADCECETPTAAVRAAAKATELQMRDFFIQ